MGSDPIKAAAILLLLAGICLGQPLVVKASNWDYTWKIRELQPGDTLLLEADDYPNGMRIEGLHGRPDAWITIRGPAKGEQPVFPSSPRARRNTIELRECSYLALENLELDGKGVDGVFGISARGRPVHHIRIENCTLRGFGAHQQTVAISTKAPAWGWILRRNRILGAGTGMYLGDSDGSKPFFAGLIEHNLILGPKGYGLQIKHQVGRPAGKQVPSGPQATIIRHNVFLKTDVKGESGPRPNVLLGGFPNSGAGSTDSYEIYGNVFWHNHTEALLQVTGRVAIHDNLFVDCRFEAISLQDHAGKTLKRAMIFHNTFHAVRDAAKFHNPAREDHLVSGNLVFGESGFHGKSIQAANNLVLPVAKAAAYVSAPSLVPGELDLFPLPGKCRVDPTDESRVAAHADFDRDFNGNKRAVPTIPGAYGGEGANPGWRPAAARKPESR